MPALFLGARYALTGEKLTSRLAERMAAYCRALNHCGGRRRALDGQEKLLAVKWALVRRLAAWVPGVWPN